MNYTKTVHDVMQLGGGTGDFKFLLIDYKKNMDRIGATKPASPVILLVDNDDGAKEIFSVLKGMGVSIGLSTTDPFYHIIANLYLIKTPEVGPAHKSAIEDLFDPTLLKTVIDGKTFDPAKEHQASGKYGKHIFADRVVKPNAASIDFSKFKPLLDRVAAVLADYAGK